MWTTIHTIDWLLWIFMAPSVIYVAFYAFVSLFPSHLTKKRTAPSNHSSFLTSHFSFLILFPAYQEDKVIVHSVRQCLKSTYPQDFYHIGVISDHMEEETNEQLRQLPITLFTPQFEKSSKAKALHYALEHTEEHYDYVIILDADNVVLSDFLEQVNASCQQGHCAIQCHRCAKNSDNDVAVLDGISEEINNTLFRKAHNRIGISSALIGSGMCFEYEWFKNHVGLFETAVEDREMEIQLMKEHIFIKYEEDILVFDEKVSRLREFPTSTPPLDDRTDTKSVDDAPLPPYCYQDRQHPLYRQNNAAGVNPPFYPFGTYLLFRNSDDSHFLPMESEVVGTFPRYLSFYLRCNPQEDAH